MYVAKCFFFFFKYNVTIFYFLEQKALVNFVDDVRFNYESKLELKCKHEARYFVCFEIKLQFINITTRSRKQMKSHNINTTDRTQLSVNIYNHRTIQSFT